MSDMIGVMCECAFVNGFIWNLEKIGPSINSF